MKKISFLSISLCLLLCTSAAQKVTIHPTSILHSVMHDVTPPLKDLPVILWGTPGERFENGEIPNQFLHLLEQDANAYLQTGNSKDPVLQDEMGNDEPVSMGINIEGIAADGTTVPPDPNGAVGTNYYIQTVNTKFAVYSKQGSLVYGPANLGTIWQGLNYPSDGDPIVLFDHLANRWLITQFSLPNYPNGPYYELIAVSQTDDPLGTWNRYVFRFSQMPDYPKFAVWPDGYYMSANSYSSGALGWKGPLAAVIERDSVLAGKNARIFLFQLDPSFQSMLPSDLDGPPPPSGTPCQYLMAGEYDVGDTTNLLLLYQLHVDWIDTVNTTFSGPAEIQIATADLGIDHIPQKGTSRKLDALSRYLMHRLEYRNFGSYESLLVNQTVDADKTNHAGVRWYEIRRSNSDWSVFQQSTYAPDAVHRWMGSLAMDGNGNIAMAYSVSYNTVYPSLAVTGRHSGDVANHMTCLEELIIAGGGSQGGESRWGDYSSMSIDPTDESTFWFTGEYFSVPSNMKWNTRIAAFTINDLQLGMNNGSNNSNKDLITSVYPNPSNDKTNIEWYLPQRGLIMLSITDISGKIVKLLLDEAQEAGKHTYELNTFPLSAGVYICHLNTGYQSDIRKILVIK
ncbi:MAG: T9SS type A sorting domain-containing protein [Bacteroidetes bacterium]|nr:T9SS type A sorting domain-containing protein [Bacteroidota bacterium]